MFAQTIYCGYPGYPPCPPAAPTYQPPQIIPTPPAPPAPSANLLQAPPAGLPTDPVDLFNLFLLLALAMLLLWLVFRPGFPGEQVVIPETNYGAGIAHGMVGRFPRPNPDYFYGDAPEETIRALIDRRYAFHIVSAKATRKEKTVMLNMEVRTSGGPLGPVEGVFVGSGPYSFGSPGSPDKRNRCGAYVVGIFTLVRTATQRVPTIWRPGRTRTATQRLPLGDMKACLIIEFHDDLYNRSVEANEQADMAALLDEEAEDPPEREYKGDPKLDVTLTGWGAIPGRLFKMINGAGEAAPSGPEATFLINFFAGEPPPAGDGIPLTFGETLRPNTGGRPTGSGGGSSNLPTPESVRNLLFEAEKTLRE